MKPILYTKKPLEYVSQNYIWDTWKQYTPEFFVTILWNDMPTCPITSSSHTTSLRNLFLCEVCGVKKSKKIPSFPNRVGLTSFQERSLTKSGKVTFHTHWHIYNCIPSGSAIFANPHPLLKSEEGVHLLIRYKVGNKIRKLLKTTSKGNEGVTVERWCEDHHRHYNLKELQRQKKMQMQKYLQDDNMLFDYVNSDLLPMTSKSNGHKRISKATDRSLRSFAQSKKSEIIHI